MSEEKKLIDLDSIKDAIHKLFSNIRAWLEEKLAMFGGGLLNDFGASVKRVAETATTAAKAAAQTVAASVKEEFKGFTKNALTQILSE
jgi:hypothetical protein